MSFNKIKQERKSLGFFKIFQSRDLSSEYMRGFPYKFISKLPEKDLSSKMVIRAQWGKTWDLEVCQNSRYYYMKQTGWDKFVTDNALGKDEFVTFIHKGEMIFDVLIYDHHCKEILVPRRVSSSGIKKEEGDCSLKNVKKEEEQIDESPGRVGIKTGKKKCEEIKTPKEETESKRVKTTVERGESSRGVESNIRMRTMERGESSRGVESNIRMRNRNKKSIKMVNGVPQFTITIQQSYLKFLAIPKPFVDKYLPSENTEWYTVRHPNGNSWMVRCLVNEIRTMLSGGYSKLAREYPLMVGDECTFKLIKPLEFLLLKED